MAVIYLITNTINNKKYIGVTIDFKQRIYGHKYAPNRKMEGDIIKYGWDSFSKEIVLTGTIEECYNKEQIFIEEYECEYNTNIGGYGNTGIIGENNGMAIMTESLVISLREYYHNNSITFINLGTLYNISSSQANKIVHGKFWADVGGPIVSERLNTSNAKTKISKEEVRSMREKYFKGNFTMKELGEKFSLSQQQSSRIIRGLRWKEAGGPIKGIDY